MCFCGVLRRLRQGEVFTLVNLGFVSGHPRVGSVCGPDKDYRGRPDCFPPVLDPSYQKVEGFGMVGRRVWSTGDEDTRAERRFGVGHSGSESRRGEPKTVGQKVGISRRLSVTNPDTGRLFGH